MMSNNYLIEVTQQQVIIVEIDKAETSSEAIKLASLQQGKVTQQYPVKIANAKVIKEDFNEQS